MPSTRKLVSFRPDAEEVVLLEKIGKERAISLSRVIGQLVREEAKRQGMTASKEEIAQAETEWSKKPQK